METIDKGSIYAVSLTKSDVEEFASRWPCFGPCRGLTFEYEKSTGDLVGIIGNDSDMDPAGVTALSKDCQDFLQKP